MEIKFRLYKAGLVQILIVGYLMWNQKTHLWVYSQDNEHWNSKYIEHMFKDIYLGITDTMDVELYLSDIVSCNSIEDGDEHELLFTISYCELLSSFILISPNKKEAEPLYFTGADILTKIGCMHIDYKLFKLFAIGSKKIKL